MNAFKFFTKAALLLAAALLGGQAQAQTPEWIWHDNKGASPADNEAVYYRKTFTVDGPVASAEVVTAGDNQSIVYINGKQVLHNTSWDRPSRGRVGREIKQGENLIAALGKNEGGEAATLVKLEITLSNGKKQVVVSDTSWTSSKTESQGWQTAAFQPSGWTKAVSKGKLGVAPWGDVMSTPTATPLAAITAAPGFKVEMLRSSQGEGSWVAMAIDPKGRLIVSPQEGVGNLLRITLTAGQVEKVETIALPVGGAMGLLCAFDSLYVSGNGPSGLGLYRLKDTNGDDQYDKVEYLKKFEGAGGEHGSHAVVLGPDNMLYYIHGNFAKIPGDISPNSAHKHYAEDQLLPRGEDGNGFGVGIKPPGGFVVRGDPDGKNWELVAAGMRNSYDFAFNPHGEMFTFDSDMEWDWGMPWYRPIRIYHLVSGGDYGFREGTGKYPRYYPDALPPTMDIGIGCPTGVKFGTGAKFPAKYQRALYAMDWSYGRIFAVHLAPQGASYAATSEVFVQGKPLNVTDMEVGKDGALYFMTGGRGTQSGLYRVSYVGTDSTAPVDFGADASTQEAAARTLRHQLEAFHGKKDPAALDFAWKHLRSSDRWIRYAARIAIESQDVATWQERALDEEQVDAGLTALLALARLGDSGLQKRIITALGKFQPDQFTDEQRLAALRVLNLAFIRMGKPDAEFAGDIVEAVNPLYPSKSEDLNRELCQTLIYLEAPGVVEKTLALIESAPSLEEQIHYVFHLRTLKTGWTIEQRQRYFSWFNRNRQTDRHPAFVTKWFTDAGRDYGDGASFPGFMNNMRKDAVARLSDSERGELASYITGKSVAAKPAPVVQRPFVKEWKMEELASALGEVSKGRSFQKGKEAFTAAQCFVCHRMGNEGGAVGPDITAVSSRFTRRDVAESILEPSKVVSEQYQNTTLILKNEDEITGRVVEDTEQRLVLITNPLLGTKTEVKKSDIKKREASKLSPMPEGLANVLTKSELLDLLAYIEAGGKESSPLYK